MCDLNRPRRTQCEGDQHDHDALAQAEPEIGSFIAACLNDMGNRDHGQSGARPETGGGKASGEAAPVREPAHCVADGGTENGAGAETGDDLPRNKATPGCRLRN